MNSKFLSALDGALAHALEHWQTSGMGLVLLVSAGWKIYHNPALLGSPDELMHIVGGVGFAAARDPQWSATPSPGQPPGTPPPPKERGE